MMMWALVTASADGVAVRVMVSLVVVMVVVPVASAVPWVSARVTSRVWFSQFSEMSEIVTFSTWYWPLVGS